MIKSRTTALQKGSPEC